MTSPTPDPMPQPGPKDRTIRSVVQALIAVLVAVPAAVALVPIPDKYQGSVAVVVGISAGAVVLITAGMNALEQRRGAPFIGGGGDGGV